MKAIEFPDGLDWINSQQLKLKDLKGKIVLLDFWTYCCINCMHIIPELKKIEEDYPEEVVVIGVHSAKFPEERETKNIEIACKRYGITHPVVNDKNMEIWSLYDVPAWPTLILIDTEGNIVLKVAGEGWFPVIRNYIEKILDEKGENIKRDVFISGYDDIRRDFYFPAKISFDKYIAISDSGNMRILVIDRFFEVLHIIGGEDEGDEDGEFKKAKFRRPQGLYFNEEKIYICDTENHKIKVADLKEGKVYTLFGTGEMGFLKEDIERGNLNSPWDITYGDGIFYCAMAGCHRIVSFQGNKISVFAGNGYEGIKDGERLSAHLAQPSGIKFYKGKIFFADSETSSIRIIEGDFVRTIVGKGLFIFGYKDGPSEIALLQHPLGIDVFEDTIFVADTYNNAIRVIVDKKVMTFRLKTELYEPSDVKIIKGKIFIADTNNHRIVISDTYGDVEELKIKIPTKYHIFEKPDKLKRKVFLKEDGEILIKSQKILDAKIKKDGKEVKERIENDTISIKPQNGKYLIQLRTFSCDENRTCKIKKIFLELYVEKDEKGKNIEVIEV